MKRRSFLKKFALICLNFGFLLALSAGSLPSCGGEPEPNKVPTYQNPNWEVIAEDSATSIKVWSSAEATSFVFASAPQNLMNHESAIAYCENLKITGFENSFRIPSESEMKQIQNDFNFSEIPAFNWHRTAEANGVTEKYAFYWIKETTTADEVVVDGIELVYPTITKKVEAGLGINVYSYKSEEHDILKETITTQLSEPRKDAGIICISDL